MENDGLAIVPGNGTEGYVELARSRQGRIFKKHILNYGELLYPGVKGGKVVIDDDFTDKLITNFSNKVCDIVQVPKAGANNEHTEDPDRNIGEVIGIEKEDGKVYTLIDARSAEDADKLGKTLLGASAMMHMDYTDTRTGQKVGPTLLHVAVTNRPYVTDLEEYKEIGEVVAASADGKSGAVVLTAPQNPKEKKSMSTLDELISELRTDHNIDVPALQAAAATADQGVTLSNDLADKLSGVVKLSNGDQITTDDIVTAFTELHDENVELSRKVDTLTETGAKNAAEARVDALVKEGRILPKNKDAQVRLLLSNSELFEELLPEKPLVKLSNTDEDAEAGFEPTDDQHEKTVQDEVARLSNVLGTVAPGVIKA